MKSLKTVLALSVASVVASARSAAREVSAPVLVAGASLAAVSGAQAAATTIDTTDIVATITGGVTTISSIGVAVISLVVVIKLYKWVQRVL